MQISEKAGRIKAVILKGKGENVMDAEMKEMFGVIIDKIGEMDKKIGEMDKKIGEMDKRFDSLEQKVEDNHKEIVKTQVMIESKIEPKIDALFEGYCMNLESQARIRQHQIDLEKGIAFWKEK